MTYIARGTNIISPAQLTADQDNYAPTGGDNAAIWRLGVDTVGRSISGIAGGYAHRHLTLINIETGVLNVLTLLHNSSSSDAANRMLLPNMSNLTIGPCESVELVYDIVSAVWRIKAVT